MLFKTAADIQQYTRLSQVEYLALKPIIATAESKHLVPLLGSELYTELCSLYEAAQTTPLTEPMTKLLDYSRRVVGPYACVMYAPKADLQLSESGAQRMETDTHKSAFQYQIRNYIQANQQEGDIAAENLLAFLEENIADYPLWSAVEYRSLFIKSGKEFNEYFPTAAPAGNYRRLRSTLKDVEESTIRKFLGDTIFEDLKTKTKAGTTLSELEKDLLYLINKSTAAFAIANALPFVNLKIEDGTVTQSGGTGASDDKLRSRATPTDNAMSAFIRRAESLGKIWLRNAEDFLKKNSDTFPDWRTEAAKSFENPTSFFGLI